MLGNCKTSAPRNKSRGEGLVENSINVCMNRISDYRFWEKSAVTNRRGRLEKIVLKDNFGMRNACRKYSIEYFRSATAAGTNGSKLFLRG